MALDYPDGIHVRTLAGRQLNVYCGMADKVMLHLGAELCTLSDESVQDLITWLTYHQLWRKENE